MVNFFYGWNLHSNFALIKKSSEMELIIYYPKSVMLIIII